MNEMLLTTAQIAMLLEVHQSTIKRWSEQTLKSLKTPGGHRRFELEKVLEFGKKMGIKSVFLEFENFETRFAQAFLKFQEKNQTESMASLFREWCFIPEKNYISLAIDYLVERQGISLGRIFDRIIGQALQDIGWEWSKGLLTVGQEHMLTQRFVDALYIYRSQIWKAMEQNKNRRKASKRALVGCAEGSRHDLGAFFCRLILERAGWDTIYLGQDVPYEEFSNLQKHFKCQMICVSFVAPQNVGDVRRCLRILSEIRDPGLPFQLIVGGGSIQQFNPRTEPWSFAGVEKIHSIESFENWLKK